ncbi:MAG TPA: hypothetical protein VMS22_13830 [Candidatus Eisenbacteria bacterium]|nr:hypothetical protein [Candidatus Eisenbacteria bacterium]
MTFEERVRALEDLGFSDRQTRFLVTVALHSGFCLRRHYAAFSGLAYGAGVREFLDRLVVRKLAKRLTFRRDRGLVYHLHASRIYAAIGQDDNRNRRRASAALIARKLMLFDYVLEHPTAEWYATEADKVALFTAHMGLSSVDLPRRHYIGRDRTAPPTTRFFVHKLPILVSGDPPTVAFVFLVTETTGALFAQFLEDHLALLDRLPRWQIVAVAPRHVRGLTACAAALRRVAAERERRRTFGEIDALQTYYTRRAQVERDDYSFLTGDINTISGEWHAARRHFAAMEYEALFERWKSQGPAALDRRPGASLGAALADGRGALLTHELPIRYDRFGTRAGVS